MVRSGTVRLLNHLPMLLVVAALASCLLACGGGNGDPSSNSSGSAIDLLYASFFCPGTGMTITAYGVASDGSLASLGAPLKNSNFLLPVMADTAGQHLFLNEGSALLTYSVQSGTGALQQTSSAALPVQAGVFSVLMNPAGNLMFVQLQTGLPGPEQFVIASYAVDNSGNLTLTHTTATYAGVGAGMVIHPAGTFLYAALSPEAGSLPATIIQLAIDSTGALTPVSSTPITGGFPFQTLIGPTTTVAEPPTNLAMAPNGTALYVGQSWGAHVQVFSVDPSTGNLTQSATVDCNCASNYFLGMGSANSGGAIMVNSTGTLLFQATSPVTIDMGAITHVYGSYGVALYQIDQKTGALTPLGNSFIPLPSVGLNFVLDRSGRFLFVSGTDQIWGFSVTDTGTVIALPTVATNESVLLMLGYPVFWNSSYFIGSSILSD